MRSETSPEQREALLRELKVSGLSMAEFCRRRGLVYGTMAGWRSASRRKSRAFVEVDSSEVQSDPDPPCPEDEASRPLAVELLLPGGIVVRVFEADRTKAMGGCQ